MSYIYEKDGFQFRIATDDEIPVIQKLRYEIFGVGSGFLDEKECPEHLDIDCFDPYSTTLLAFKDEKIAGFCRMTFDNPCEGCYVEKFFHIPEPPVNRNSVAEVNRFCILPQHRDSLSNKAITMGLFYMLSYEAHKKDITCVYFCVHKSFLLILKRMGVPADIIDGYKAKEYKGYYEKYFDPGDVIPLIVNVEKFKDFSGFGMQS
jgi:N-acyl-L-homoserine lactone synthetase